MNIEEIKDKYHLLLSQLIIIHGSMPNKELNKIIGSSIDCIEKMNQYINTIVRLNNSQFVKIQQIEADKLDIMEICSCFNDICHKLVKDGTFIHPIIKQSWLKANKYIKEV